MKYLIIFFILITTNSFSQAQKIARENIILILEQTTPTLAKYIFTKNKYTSLSEKEYEYKYTYGEYIKNAKPFANRKFNYNSDGISELDYWKKPIDLGSKGEQLNKPYIKYKYNQNGDINEINYYSNTSGKLKNTYYIKYNNRNQIFEIANHKGESKKFTSITTYQYNKYDDKISMLTFKPTSNKLFPKFKSFKANWTYDANNHLKSYESYRNIYGYYNTDLTRYNDRKLVKKSLNENLKKQEESWKDYLLYEFHYTDDLNYWTKRKEYKYKNSQKKEKEYKKILEREFNI